VGSADLRSSIWLNKPQAEQTEHINHRVEQLSKVPVSIATGADYDTVFETDVKGFTNFTVMVAAGGPNDITYRIQGIVADDPKVWGGIKDQVDIDVTASDIENMGVLATFTANISRLRVQAKQKSQPGRAWAGFRATR
jgi:hypothetical protein